MLDVDRRGNTDVKARCRTMTRIADIGREYPAAAVGQRLRFLREAQGMRQSAWCRAVGITQQKWNSYERGVSRISLNQALKLCDLAGVTLDWLFRGISQIESTPSESEGPSVRAG
jgi:DNA-binding XRE family transcriptional regulator